MANSYTIHNVYNAVKRIADKKVYWTYVEKYACKIWLRSAPNNIQGSMDIEVRWYKSSSKLDHLKELGYIFRDNNGIESYCKSVFVGNVEDVEILVREIAMIFEEIFDIPFEGISICETWEAHRTYFEDRGMLYKLAPPANSKTKLYLDIDGVLLTARNPQPAEYADEFIKFVTDNFDCYWLTTHCKGYDTTPTLEYLSLYFSEDTMKRLEWVKSTSWSVLKTEGIDFGSKFYWIDDYIMLAERMELERLGKTDSFIKVNLSEISLRDIMEELNKSNNVDYKVFSKSDIFNEYIKCVYLGVIDKMGNHGLGEYKGIKGILYRRFNTLIHAYNPDGEYRIPFGAKTFCIGCLLDMAMSSEKLAELKSITGINFEDYGLRMDFFQSLLVYFASENFEKAYNGLIECSLNYGQGYDYAKRVEESIPLHAEVEERAKIIEEKVLRVLLLLLGDRYDKTFTKAELCTQFDFPGYSERTIERLTNE